MPFYKIFNPRENEKVIMHLWPHPYIFLKIVVGYLALLLLPGVIYYIIIFVFPSLLANVVWSQFLTVTLFIYLLMATTFSFFIWCDTFLDFWTITNKRIISREQKGLFNRVTSELELYRVQDVSVEQKGVLATILNFGHLHIQSAAEQNRFEFKNVGEPVKISRLIQRLDSDAKKQQFNQSQTS